MTSKNLTPKQEREFLDRKLLELHPALTAFVKEVPCDITYGSWDLTSYSFQLGFEAMWDAARSENSGLLTRPLLHLWRQSVELALKSAIVEVSGISSPALKHGHRLPGLLVELVQLLKAEGIPVEDELSRQIKEMIDCVYSVDPAADRFRYPSDIKNTPYIGVSADLLQLYQSHQIIITWCEGIIQELKPCL